LANHTITISNTLSFFGGDQATLWGNTGNTTMTWGVDNWGGGSEDSLEQVVKVLSNDLTFSGSLSQFLSSVVVTNTLSISSDITDIYLSNGIWNRIFPGGTLDADSQISTTWA